MDLADIRVQAARLAFAMLRFEDGAAHLRPGASDERPRVGAGCFMFTPSWTQMSAADVAPFLAGLASPALLSCTTTRGVYNLTLLEELNGERRACAQKTLDNCAAFMRRVGAQLQLTPESNIILQFDDQEVVFSFAALLTASSQFAVQVGANMRPYSADERAKARLMLFRSDGAVCWGGSCLIRTIGSDGAQAT
jgi:hypothetical protein